MRPEMPQGWAVEPIEAVAEVLLSNVDKKSSPEEVPVQLCNYMDVYSNPEITTRLPFMEATATAAQVEKFGLRLGDVLITKDSEDPSDIAVPSVVVDRFDEPVVCGYHLALLRPRKIHGPYLSWALRSRPVNNQFVRRANGTTRFGLTSAVIRSAEIPLPPLPEQRKIAAILSSVDDAIAATRKVVDQAKRVKQGLLLTLMNRGIGHTWFKKTQIGEIPEPWDVSTVGTHFDTQLGKMLNKKARIGPNQLPYLGNAQVQWTSVDFSDVPTMHFEESELQKFSLERGDLLVCEGGEIGRTAIWSGEIEGCCFQKAVHRLRPRASYVPGFFLRYMMLAASAGRFAGYSARTSISHLTQEKLRRMPIPVPPPSEQEEISAAFDKVDRAIQHHYDVAHAMSSLKRGLMEDLLTGRVRVQPD